MKPELCLRSKQSHVKADGKASANGTRAQRWTYHCDQLRKSADGLYEMCERAQDVAATKVSIRKVFFSVFSLHKSAGSRASIAKHYTRFRESPQVFRGGA